MDRWCFSETHGWVVLDRTIPCNQTGDDLLLFRWRDLKTFRCPFDDWDEPLYMLAPNYLRGLPDAATQAVATQEFESLKDRWSDMKAELQRQLNAVANEQEKVAHEKKKQQAINNHRHFLDSRGIPYQGISEVSPEKRHRVAHCYSCKDELDNSINPECTACKWILCDCGACGCGYERHH